jgi:hypothetical protein
MMLRWLRYFIIVMLISVLGGIGVARSAPLLADLPVDGNIVFSNAGQDGARDIHTTGNTGGMRFYNADTLTTTPGGAAIQFFGNGSTGFPGQAFIDSGANNNAAVIFRSAPTGGVITERMRVDAQGNVGIGTSTPGEKLTVRGSERILGESNPVERGSVTSANLDQPRSVFVSGHYAYVTAGLANRLVIVDIANPTAPVEVGSVTSANLVIPGSVFVSGRYAYVTALASDRLVVVDVSDPTAPVEVGSVTSATLDGPSSVFVSGRYAYVAAGNSDSLVVVDVSDPTAPAVKGFATSANLDNSNSVFVSGRYAYIAAGISDRLVVVDVSDPATPTEVGSVTSANLDTPVSVFVSGRYAYVTAAGSDRLVVIDVSDPTVPVEVGSITSANLNGASTVFVGGRYAYVAAQVSDRLVVVDVSDPTVPVEKGSVTSANLDGANGVFVAGRYAYVGGLNSDRLVVLNLDHLEAPTVEAGVVQAGSLDVASLAVFNNGVNVRGGLNVGDTGALISGDLTVGGDENLTEKLRVLGDVKIGTGTTGCVKDADNTTLTGTCVSDARLKADVTPFNPVLASLARLQPAHFTWRGDEYPELNLGTARSFGLIADEAEKLFPEMVSTNEQGFKVVRYHLLPFLMLQGIRELVTENETLKADLQEKDDRIAALEQQNAAQEARLSALERLVGNAPLVQAPR